MAPRAGSPFLGEPLLECGLLTPHSGVDEHEAEIRLDEVRVHAEQAGSQHDAGDGRGHERCVHGRYLPGLLGRAALSAWEDVSGGHADHSRRQIAQLLAGAHRNREILCDVGQAMRLAFQGACQARRVFFSAPFRFAR